MGCVQGHSQYWGTHSQPHTPPLLHIRAVGLWQQCSQWSEHHITHHCPCVAQHACCWGFICYRNRMTGLFWSYIIISSHVLPYDSPMAGFCALTIREEYAFCSTFLWTVEITNNTTAIIKKTLNAWSISIVLLAGWLAPLEGMMWKMLTPPTCHISPL